MKDKTVLITGSSRGIGRATARRMAVNGWKVVIHYARDKSEAEKLSNELGASCAGVFQADLSAPQAGKKLFEAVTAKHTLSAIVNNAGIYMPSNFLSAKESEFEATLRKTFTVNFEEPLRLARLFVQYVTEQKTGGKILNVCSRVGFKGEAGAAIYAASKAALVNVTRSLAIELAPKNIQVFGIAPGWVDTAMARDGMTERLTTILKDIPLGRMATPEDCAATIAFLLSDSATYLSGNVLDINGASYFH